MKAIVALFDKASRSYMQPMFVPALGVAYRNLSDEIARGGEGNVLTIHHSDFQLFQLGVYDDETGEIILEVEERQDQSGNAVRITKPKFICEVSSLVLPKE